MPTYCQHSNHCRIHEMHCRECADCRAADVREVRQFESGSWFILDSVGLRADSHGYGDLNDALNHVVYGPGYAAATGREPASRHPACWPENHEGSRLDSPPNS